MSWKGIRSTSWKLLKHVLPSIFAASLLAILAKVAAQAPAMIQLSPEASGLASGPRTTLAVFPDPATGHPIPDGLWPALVTALDKELAANALETQAILKQTGSEAASRTAGADPSLDVEIIRGDRIVSGIVVTNPIAVYLHGECRIVPRPVSIFSVDVHVSGALGWVESSHGQIAPFIHVDCNRLAEMLAAKAFGRDAGERNQWMAAAIARVVIHEWIHVVTQNPHHSDRGISKPEFSVNDLLTNLPKPAPHRRTRLSAASVSPGPAICQPQAPDAPLPVGLRGDE